MIFRPDDNRMEDTDNQKSRQGDEQPLEIYFHDTKVVQIEDNTK